MPNNRITNSSPNVVRPTRSSSARPIVSSLSTNKNNQVRLATASREKNPSPAKIISHSRAPIQSEVKPTYKNNLMLNQVSRPSSSRERMEKASQAARNGNNILIAKAKIDAPEHKILVNPIRVDSTKRIQSAHASKHSNLLPINNPNNFLRAGGGYNYHQGNSAMHKNNQLPSNGVRILNLYRK